MSNAIAQLIAEAQDAPAFFTKDSKIGDSISGTISAISLRQTRDFRTNKPEAWEDGSPKQQLVIVVDSTELESDKGDDGKRSLYVKWWGVQRKAFAKAITADGAEQPVIGGELTATFVGEEPSKEKGFDPTKLYEYSYVEPTV